MARIQTEQRSNNRNYRNSNNRNHRRNNNRSYRRNSNRNYGRNNNRNYGRNNDDTQTAETAEFTEKKGQTTEETETTAQ
ncbi:MAG: hypothetical protein HYY93_08180 [Planctomycetes bacterium]|nr:hypothetical protein [Planctomycetota bacterium]